MRFISINDCSINKSESGRRSTNATNRGMTGNCEAIGGGDERETNSMLMTMLDRDDSAHQLNNNMNAIIRRNNGNNTNRFINPADRESYIADESNGSPILWDKGNKIEIENLAETSFNDPANMPAISKSPANVCPCPHHPHHHHSHHHHYNHQHNHQQHSYQKQNSHQRTQQQQSMSGSNPNLASSTRTPGCVHCAHSHNNQISQTNSPQQHPQQQHHHQHLHHHHHHHQPRLQQTETQNCNNVVALQRYRSLGSLNGFENKQVGF